MNIEQLENMVVSLKEAKSELELTIKEHEATSDSDAIAIKEQALLEELKAKVAEYTDSLIEIRKNILDELTIDVRSINRLIDKQNYKIEIELAKEIEIIECEVINEVDIDSLVAPIA